MSVYVNMASASLHWGHPSDRESNSTGVTSYTAHLEQVQLSGGQEHEAPQEHLEAQVQAFLGSGGGQVHFSQEQEVPHLHVVEDGSEQQPIVEYRYLCFSC